MPDERNYGYWVDTNCDLQFFKKFNIQMITEQEFNNLWNSVDYDRKKVNLNLFIASDRVSKQNTHPCLKSSKTLFMG